MRTYGIWNVTNQKPGNAKSTLLRILGYLANSRLIILLFLICTLAANIGNLLGPMFAGKAIGVIEEGFLLGKGFVDMGRVARYILIMLACYVGSSVVSFIVNIGMMRMGYLVARRMRQEVFDKLMVLPVRYFDQNQVGDIISRMNYDVDVVCTCLSADIINIMTSIITVAGSFIMMCTISLPLVLCVAATIPISILYTRYMGAKARPLYAKRSAAYGAMNGFAEEMFTGQRTILAYAQEERICTDFSKVNHGAADAYFEADSLGCHLGPTVNMISNFGLASIGTGGAIMYILKMVGLEQLSSFMLYSRKFSGPINEISNIINEFFSAMAAAERVFALLDEPEECKDVEGAAELPPDASLVEARDVGFSYVPGKPVLKHLNFEAKPGQTIAIVGPTGAGKTTIINLLMRFYDPGRGCIMVDGRDALTYKMDSLRGGYTMVLQDTWVFRGTIFDNIAYGSENAGMDEVVEAARAARIHYFIMRLPEGYNTVISEDGTSISKGQKQLLTIARAMLCKANMLILDEATSNVDTNTERKVQHAIRTLMKGKTSFVIAHRLSTIENADNILVIEHGDVVEQGTHQELMEKKGVYYQLYASQFG